MMKPSVDKILKDVQLLSKRMRTREETAEELLGKVNTVQMKLDAMRQYQEESLQYSDIAKRTEGHPRHQLILCLAAENKQLEQLKMHNQTLETSLNEHQSALEMIMTKYREQISNLMRTNEAEKMVQRASSCKYSENVQPSKTQNPEKQQITPEQQALMDERLIVMAAIAQEVTERSEQYSVELETELHRLRTENSGLRDLLSIKVDLSAARKLSETDDGSNLSRLPFQPPTKDQDGGIYEGKEIPLTDENPTPTKDI